jgi:hypothetical protein
VVPDRVAEADDAIHPQAIEPVQHHGERLEVRVNVGDETEPHALRPRSFVPRARA